MTIKIDPSPKSGPDKQPMSSDNGSLQQQDEKLFDSMNGEYKNIINQFALAVFGIGAFFFAAGQQTTTPRLKQLIDLIAFGASVTMWIHMHGAHEQIRAIRKELKVTSPTFMKRYETINSWRHKGWSRIFFYPVTRLMTYFMGLVALAWLVLSLNGLGSGFGVNFPLEVFPFLVAVCADGLVFALIFAIVRRTREIWDEVLLDDPDTLTLTKEARTSKEVSKIAFIIGTILTAVFVILTIAQPPEAPSRAVLFLSPALISFLYGFLRQEGLKQYEARLHSKTSK